MKQALMKSLPAIAPVELVAKVNRGLPVSEFFALRDLLDLTNERLCALIDLSRATLSRRQRDGDHFDTHVSERLVRYARLFRAALDYLDGDEAKARLWLNTPARALSGVIPLEFARSETGAREVESLIYQLDQGIYV